MVAEPGGEAEQRRAAEARHRREVAERLQRDVVVAEHREIAEGRQQDAGKAGGDRHDQDQERGEREEPEHRECALNPLPLVGRG